MPCSAVKFRKLRAKGEYSNMTYITDTHRISNWILIIFVALSLALLAGCEKKYPEGGKPNGALSRNVTTEIDRMIGQNEFPGFAIATEGNAQYGFVKMVTVKLDGVGLVATVGEGGRVLFNKNISIEGTEFKTGDELVKKNGWWCPAKAE